MSGRIVRDSKFRHVFGTALRKEDSYDNIRITNNSWDSNFCAVNPKFLAVVTEAAGGGAFLVITLKSTGKVDPNAPLVAGHKGAVLDIQWCPFDDNIIASASDDAIVRIWQIPDGGLIRTLNEPAAELVGHQRRVGMILWHPTAENILLSCGSDNKIIIWDVGTAEPITEIEHPDAIFHCAWSWDGSRLATTCKDRKIRIYDARTGDCEAEGEGHEGAKAQRIVCLKNDLIFTTGFSRMSERQYALRSESNLSEPIVLEVLDTSNGVLFPFYDPDVNLLYLAAKGDSNIRYFEITEEPPYVHYLNTFVSSESGRGHGWMPKLGVDLTKCEINRLYKMISPNRVQVISMVCPRKGETFQSDIYPDTQSDVPSCSAEEWAKGIDRERNLVSLGEMYQAKVGGKGLATGRKKPTGIGLSTGKGLNSGKGLSASSRGGPGLSSSAKSSTTDLSVTNGKNRSRGGSGDSSSAGPTTTTLPPSASIDPKLIENLSRAQKSNDELTAKVSELSGELHKLKAIVLKHEVRIRELEKLNSNDEDPDD